MIFVVGIFRHDVLPSHKCYSGGEHMADHGQ